MTEAGDPTAIEYSGISFVTTEFAPIIQFLPIEAPIIDTFSPIQELSPIITLDLNLIF